MKKIMSIILNGALICFIVFLFILKSGLSYAGSSQYPEKIEVIDRSQANYKTPENTLSAGFSASMKGDLEWFYECMTEASVNRFKSMFAEAGKNPRDFFKAKNEKERNGYIIKKTTYKHAILLITQLRVEDRVYTSPSAYVNQGGRWKRTSEFMEEEAFLDFISYQKLEFAVDSTQKIYPNQWNLDWYEWIKENKDRYPREQHAAEKATILCAIQELRDNDGNHYSVEDIVADSLRLNENLPSQPWIWKHRKETVIILTGSTHSLLKKNKGFNGWVHRQFGRRAGAPYRPCLLVRFNLYEAMGALPDLIPGKEYTITVSGELKNGRMFKGATTITTTSWKRRFDDEFFFPGRVPCGIVMNEWWNR